MERPPSSHSQPASGTRHSRELRHVRTALSLLTDQVAAAVASTDVYRAVAAFAKATMPSDAIFVSQYDAGREMRTCVYASDQGVEADTAELPPLPMNNSPHSRAIATGQPILTGDLDAALEGSPVVQVGVERDPRQTQSSLVVPMLAFGRVLGGIEIQSLAPGAYSKRDIWMLQLAANLAAVASEAIHESETERTSLQQARIARIEAVIASQTFFPVFQPIVDLATGGVVAYEALTRFADQSPPDLRFAEAAAVGLTRELELATLRSALDAARQLPRMVALHVNAEQNGREVAQCPVISRSLRAGCLP